MVLMFKKIVLILISFFVFSLISGSSYAHLAGQPPFFKINGVYSELYPVPTSSFPEFRLPQDRPPALYLVNEDINFELDTQTLPVPPEVLKVTEFDWNFGDDTEHGTGLKNVHKYGKAGSYFLEVTAKTSDLPQPQLIQSILVHIIPTQGYNLPEAKILVNGQGVKDPLVDDVKLEFGKEVTLDASASVPGSGKIVEYKWDLGNGKSMIGEKITVNYDKNQYALFPVLRVKDENGLISDAFIQITNKDNSFDSEGSTLLPPHIHKNLPFIIGGIVVGLLLVIGPFVYSEKIKKYLKK
jgi:hypothetical protein